MNILFLHSSSDLYGASKILIAVAALCKEKSHQVTVVLSEKGALSEKLVETGAEVIIMDLGILRRKYMNITGMFNRGTAMMSAYHDLKKICRQKNIDLIYSNTTGVIVGTFLARKLRIKHIWHVHEILEKPFLLYRVLSRLLNQKQNRVLVVSMAVKKHWSKHVEPGRITVLYNGVDHWLFNDKETGFRKEFGISNEAVVIGMMGRVHPWKGQDYFLRIAGILHKQFPETIFVSVGDAFPGNEYLYDKLDTIIREEKLEQVVKQAHYREDILNIYNSFDIFILPSLLPDPAPAVVTEAMAASIPVVITEQGGAMEMIESGLSGIVIPINQPSIAAERIAALIRDKKARIEMGQNARERILSHFSRDIFNKKIIDFIEQA
jgi:glycosyltransferase involved in cell wall biosynthesis